MMHTVILCDENGAPTGAARREEAHSGSGLLHRAFSVFVFRKGRRELLIQQRSSEKPLFPLLWANTCCSHLREGETLVGAGKSRLKQELGLDCDLTESTSFVYRAEDPQGKGTEYEYDTILLSMVQGDPPLRPDPREVNAYRWTDVEKLTKDMHVNPQRYAPWFHLSLAMIMRKATSARP